ncbi:MAG TPA: hypothetical protein ENJ28_06635, partial [Gammaproteobacteria bacterium]|nr:hypothetical protein [Gammaproteobacteria bacterium]
MKEKKDFFILNSDNMKTLHLNIITIMASLFLGACHKPDPVPPNPPVMEQDRVFELVWATRLNFEKEIVATNNTQHYKDWVLVGGDWGDPPTVMAFNKDTGEKDWEYVHQGSVDDVIYVSYVYENIYIGMCSGGIVGIDLDTRTTLWEINLQERNLTRGYKFVEHDGYLY